VTITHVAYTFYQGEKLCLDVAVPVGGNTSVGARFDSDHVEIAVVDDKGLGVSGIMYARVSASSIPMASAKCSIDQMCWLSECKPSVTLSTHKRRSH
jgi:hypothetical protein